MRKVALLGLVGLAVLAAPCLVLGAGNEVAGQGVSLAAPARPCALTQAQFEALSRLESQPQHSAILDTRASYTSEHEARMDATRFANNFFTGSYYVGFPAAILGLLIAAAPL